MSRLLLCAVLIASTGCVFVTRSRSQPAQGQPREKVVHEHCHPKKHGREVCHSHPHYDPGHH